MFQLFFDSIPNVQVYGIVALLLFFILFISTVMWAIRGRDDYMNYMKDLPLKSDINEGENSDDQTKF